MGACNSKKASPLIAAPVAVPPASRPSVILSGIATRKVTDVTIPVGLTTVMATTSESTVHLDGSPTGSLLPYTPAVMGEMKVLPSEVGPLKLYTESPARIFVVSPDARTDVNFLLAHTPDDLKRCPPFKLFNLGLYGRVVNVVDGESVTAVFSIPLSALYNDDVERPKGAFLATITVRLASYTINAGDAFQAAAKTVLGDIITKNQSFIYCRFVALDAQNDPAGRMIAYLFVGKDNATNVCNIMTHYHDPSLGAIAS